MRVTTADLIRNFGKYSDCALRDPIVITRKGRDRLVLMSVDEFNFLHDAQSHEEPPTEQVPALAPERPKAAGSHVAAGKRARRRGG